MTAENDPASDPASRHYGLPDYPVTIARDQVTATVPSPWYWFGKRTLAANLSDYVAVGFRVIGRTLWWSTNHFFYYQAVLVHRETPSRNVTLAEISAGNNWDPTVSLELRSMLERFGEEFALPVIESHLPARIKKRRDNASPEQVFGARLPDELNLSVRDLVAKGRLTVSRSVERLPRGLAILRIGDALQLTFGYSALWETLRIWAVVALITIPGSAYSRSGTMSLTRLWIMAGTAAAVTFLTFLIIFPIQYFLNGNELLLADDRWTYRPASASLLWPSVQVLSSFKPSEIEGIRRRGRDVLVLSDREIVRIRCRSRRMAKWMEQALLTVAAYGLSALDGCVSETGDAQAGATGAPASSAV